jgi:hypothetical protein
MPWPNSAKRPHPALGQDTLQRCSRVLGPERPIALYLDQVARNGHPVLSDDSVAGRPSRPLCTWTYGTCAPRRVSKFAPTTDTALRLV